MTIKNSVFMKNPEWWYMGVFAPAIFTVLYPFVVTAHVLTVFRPKALYINLLTSTVLTQKNKSYFYYLVIINTSVGNLRVANTPRKSRRDVNTGTAR